MELLIERAALLKSLAHVQSVVERRNTIPILSNVLLRAEKGKLALSATDMDLEIVDSVDAEVKKPGATTTPAHTLYDIVRKLPDAKMALELNAEGTTLTVRAGRSQFKLGCLPTEDFPQMSANAVKNEFELTATELKLLIDRARFAISMEETR
jgi:DNA polymerase-3 subunit beta